MAPATELATIPLVTGATIEDPSSPAGKVWQSSLDTISAQDGFQRLYYGRELESPDVLQLFIDWDSYDHHQAFINTPVYGPFVKHLMTLVSGSITMRHASFTPHPPSAALSSISPVTEVITAYFTTHDDNYAATADRLLKFVEQADGCKGGAGGWVIEDVEHEKLGEGKKGKAFVALVGWESKEKHMEFRESALSKENTQLLGQLSEGPVALEVHHTAFVQM